MRYTPQTVERIEEGHRAAHRGRAVVDASLCLGDKPNTSDRNVFVDLYGIGPEKIQEWMDVDQITQVAGFRASLQREKRTTEEFHTLFRGLIEMVEKLASASEVKRAFEEIYLSGEQHRRLVECFDGIVKQKPLRPARELQARELQSKFPSQRGN